MTKKQDKLDLQAMEQINRAIIDLQSIINDVENETGYTLLFEHKAAIDDAQQYMVKSLSKARSKK